MPSPKPKRGRNQENHFESLFLDVRKLELFNEIKTVLNPLPALGLAFCWLL